MSVHSATVDIEYFVDFQRIDDQIIAAAQWVAEHVANRPLQCSLSIVGDEQIREVNRDSLGHDWATDVVSFVIESTEQFVDGEVVVSYDTAVRLSPKAGWTEREELLLYIVHGLLHVAGLDDIKASDRADMREAEARCLDAIGVDATNLIERWDDVV